MEPESSLPYSQVPATCPYPESTPSKKNSNYFAYEIITSSFTPTMVKGTGLKATLNVHGLSWETFKLYYTDE